MRLVGADYLVFADVWDKTHSSAPELMGQKFQQFEAPPVHLAYGLDDSGTSVLITDTERVERVAPLLADGRTAARVLAVRTTGELPAGVDRFEDVLRDGAPLPSTPTEGCCGPAPAATLVGSTSALSTGSNVDCAQVRPPSLDWA